MKNEPRTVDSGNSTVIASPARVQLWLAQTSVQVANIATFRSLLDAGERESAARFYMERDRTQYVIAHGLVRSLLGAHLDVEPASIEFETSVHGKPYVARGSRFVHFNLSHSGDLIAIALCDDRDVGVDVERWEEIEYDVISESYFSPTERDTLRRLDSAHKCAGFFACWTRKEAYLKATGVGISEGLDHFDVSLAPDAPAQLLADRKSAQAVGEWEMHDIAVPAGYSGALVVRGANVHIDQKGMLGS